ncbi:hypothetical protein [Helicobacter cetorum]|uniref:hypothetical protein n=1 Tax=Helicobacter cetorum TaxID=138563 RepID=UPI001F479845|nr:hypothetical protein [Helicobacter cetorum]
MPTITNEFLGFLKNLNYQVHNHKTSSPFRLEEVVKDPTMLENHVGEIENLANSSQFFLKKVGDKWEKTYRIEEIAQRTLKELQKDNLHKQVIEMLEDNPLILHQEFERWLNTKHQGMLSTIIDKYWHNFIIYTYEYQSWCLDKYNRFIHHLPTPSYEKESSDNLENLKGIACYFKSYQQQYPLDESILLYNFPYRLLYQEKSFETIRAIIIEFSELV